MMALIIGAAIATKVPRGEPAGVVKWSQEIASASVRFAIPASWIARVMRAETGGVESFHGKPRTSSAGAMGLMQLMPATWREMRAALGLGPDPFDPRDNILAGAAYLREMYDRFGYPGLFGAYNAGPNRYARYIAGAANLPSETRSYLIRTAGHRRTISLVSAPSVAPRGPPGPVPSDLFALEPRGADHKRIGALFAIRH